MHVNSLRATFINLCTLGCSCDIIVKYVCQCPQHLSYPHSTPWSYPHYSQGAVNIDEEEQQKKKDKSAAFQGSGFKLGDSEGPSVQIRGRARDQSSEKVCNSSCASTVLWVCQCAGVYSVHCTVYKLSEAMLRPAGILVCWFVCLWHVSLLTWIP